MTDKERKDFLKALEKVKKEVTKDKESARQFLVDVGIITLKGNLRKPYRNLRF